MASLFEKMQARNTKEPAKEETVNVTINRIVGTSNPLKVVMKCDVGDIFTYVSAFPNGKAPMIAKPIKAEVLLREKGEYVNVISITYDSEQLGKYNLVAGFGNAVAL